MADIYKVADIEKELFDLRYEVYRLRKQGKQAERDKAKKNSQARTREVPGRQTRQSLTPRSISRSEAGVVETARSTAASSNKAILEALEKDELLRQISELETELVDLQCNRAKDDQHTTSHVDEARKRERKAFQTLASHDAALIADFEKKVAFLESERDSMKKIIDEVSKKAVLYVEQIEEKEKLIREQTATLDLLQRELERVKERNMELNKGLDHMEQANPTSTSSSVTVMEDDDDAVSRVPKVRENLHETDSIPSPSFLDVTGPVSSGFKSHSTGKQRSSSQEDGASAGLERLTTGESEAGASTTTGESKFFRNPVTPGRFPHPIYHLTAYQLPMQRTCRYCSNKLKAWRPPRRARK